MEALLTMAIRKPMCCVWDCVFKNSDSYNQVIATCSWGEIDSGLSLQTWKNETLAEQNKLPPTEKPTLLSKDIELKIAALDREVQYLLNKAKFAKPRPKKEKNTTKTDSGKNATAPPDSEKVIPPKEEKQEGEHSGQAGVPVSISYY